MPLNPPPSVITDQFTVIELHDRLSVISEDKVEPTPTVIMCQTCGVCSQSLHGSVRSHYSYSANGPPPPTPASSDILDDTQSSYSAYAPSSRGDINRHNRPHRSPHRTHKRRRHRHRRMPRMGSPISDSIVEETELLPMSRHFHGGSMEDNSTVMGSQYTCLYVETDQDPFAPPPTPCTNYVSEAAYLSEDSRPPSPANTERSIGPFPPPPSPTSQLQ